MPVKTAEKIQELPITTVENGRLRSHVTVMSRLISAQYCWVLPIV